MVYQWVWGETVGMSVQAFVTLVERAKWHVWLLPFYQAKHRDSCTLQRTVINHYQLEVVLWWLNTTKLLYGSNFIVTCHFTCSFCWITAFWLPIKLGEVLRWQFNWHLCTYLLQKHERRFVSVCREHSNERGLILNKWIKISKLNLFPINKQKKKKKDKNKFSPVLTSHKPES